MTTQSIQLARSTQFLNWLNAVSITAWAALLLKYYITGEIALLVHPRFNWIVLVTSLFLLLLSGFKNWQLLQKRSQPQAQHFTSLPAIWASGLLVVAAVLGLLTTPQALGSTAAVKQGIAENLISTRVQPQAFRGSLAPEDRTLLQWARTLAVYPEPDRYAGQKVKIQGFVVHPEDLSEQYFVLTRFVIAHCAIDAYPVGMLVKLTESRQAYPPDRWLEVQGQLITETLNGKRDLVIEARSLQAIPEPETPYEYN